MSAAPRIQANEIQARGVARQFSMSGVRLLLAGTALLATRFYFVKELLFFLAALAILFAAGTAICLLVVVGHEGGRWSFCKLNEAVSQANQRAAENVDGTKTKTDEAGAAPEELSPGCFAVAK